jgi:hypothetical protein
MKPAVKRDWTPDSELGRRKPAHRTPQVIIYHPMSEFQNKTIREKLQCGIARLFPSRILAASLAEKLAKLSPADLQASLKSLLKQLECVEQSNSTLWETVATVTRELEQWGYLSFSQSGEDAVLYHFLRNQPTGFYVDVGANHPVRFSNTYLFYLLGWNGVNVEPTVGSKIIFDKCRPRDINLEVAVGDAGKDTLFIFEETCFNTMNSNVAEHVISSKTSVLVERRVVEKIPLTEVFDLYAKHVCIDFLSVDAEGLDEEILGSNNWEKYRPRYVVAERHTNDPVRATEPETILESAGYKTVGQTPFSVIYRDPKNT